MFKYYAVKVGENSFDLRQSRYRKMFESGKEHPHDLMMVGFSADAMRNLCESHSWDADLSALT